MADVAGGIIPWYKNNTILKRKFRWLFTIYGLTNFPEKGVNTLPPSKANRPALEFKEMEVQHLNETIFYPAKPEWKPITLMLYDIKTNNNPVFKWLKEIYNPQDGTWTPNAQFKRNATLQMLDACLVPVETWVLESVWPQSVNFGELDMGSSEVAIVEVTLRYDRAYMQEEELSFAGIEPNNEID
jgi:hypothetical protein